MRRSPDRELTVGKENALFQTLQALKTNRHKRNELGELFVEGVAAIKKARANGLDISRVIYADRAGLSDWGQGVIADHPGAQRIRLSGDLMKRLSDKEEPSELIVIVKKPRRDLGDCAIPPVPFIVVMDRPSNHGNLGSIIRSCDAFGVDLVVTTGHTVDIHDPAVIRASLGAVFSTRTVHEESSAKLEEWLGRVKAANPGFIVAGTDSASDRPLAPENLKRPIALIFGNEARGISVRLKQFADRMISIPMKGQVNSLNVACAASICLYQVFARGRSG